jgi:serine-type D-Ala-D-Ala carboxypeptidase/endopeptidase (penicillin-binding protein 4)
MIHSSLLFKTKLLVLTLGKLVSLSILLLLIPVLKQKVLADNRSTSSANINKSTRFCSADLSKEIDTVINRPQWKRSRWGILIQPLNAKTPIYSHDAEKYFTPASNLKLLTTAAALLQLGSQYRIRTSAYATGITPNLTSLRVVGRGDPSFTTKQLKELVKQIKARGINSIDTLIVDDRYFQKPNLNASWEWSDLYSDYAPSINSLILNENATTLTLVPQKLGQSLQLKWSDFIASRQWQIKNNTIAAPTKTKYGIAINPVYGKSLLEVEGKLAIDATPDVWNLAIVDPANYFLESLRVMLLNEGISVKQGFVVDRDSPAYDTEIFQEIAAIASPTIAELITTTNQESNNLYAESLLKIIGITANNSNEFEILKDNLTKIGVDLANYVLTDGSGLSRQNLVSPIAIVQTLQQMAKIPEAEIYKQSLPVAGVSGTLKNRFKNTPVRGKLQAKTGTISGTSSLSGYFQPSNYQPLVFSIIIDKSDESNQVLRQAIDEIILISNRLHNCP